MTQTSKKTPAPGATDMDTYRLTAREHAARHKYLTNEAAEAPRAEVIRDRAGKFSIETNHPVEVVGRILLMEAIGTADDDFLNSLLSQLANVSRGNEIQESELNFMLSVIKGIEPRDQLECMLAAQMAAVHMATMTFARRLANADNITQQDSAERAFNKVAKTFAAQMEALKRYRTGGEQKVTVHHVSVSDGGQAIVGNVTQNPHDIPVQAGAPGAT